MTLQKKPKKKEQNEITELLNELLDMDIEITLEVDEKGTVFINRPHIPYYDDKEDIGVVPLDRSISLYVKRDGEFYENWHYF